EVLVPEKVRSMKRQHFAGAHRGLADRECRSLQDESVVVGAALARSAVQPLVLLVRDDLEVRSIDPALALARAQAGELVTLDQVAVERVVEELSDRLLDLGSLRPRPRHRLIAGEAVER